MPRSLSYISVIFVPLMLASTVTAEPTYWQDIRPVFRKHCIVCHSTKNLKEVDVSAGLALDNYQAAIKGTKHLVARLKESDEDKRMPKDASPLPAETIKLIEVWIASGVKEGAEPAAQARDPVPNTTKKRTRHLDVVLTAVAHPRKPELVLKAGPLAPVTAVAYSPDGRLLATGAYGRVTVWDLETGQPIKVLTNVLGAVNDVRFSPNGQLLAVAGGQPSFRGDLRLYSTGNWQLLGTLGGHEDVVFSVAFSPDAQRLASASFDKTVRVWNLTALKQQLVIGDHSDFVYSVAFSPDGKTLVSSSKDRSVKVFDAASGKSLLTCSGMDQDVLAVAFSPDGKSIVSSGYESGIYWWNPQTAERVRVQNGHGIAVHELAFSKDGKLLVSAGADNTARIWDGTNGSPQKTLPVGAVTYAIAVHPNGKQIATGSFDGFVRLWDVASGRLLVTLISLPSSDDKPMWTAVTPEGYYNASGEQSAPAVEWRVNGQPAAEDVWKPLLQAEMVAKACRGEAVAAPQAENKK